MILQKAPGFLGVPIAESQGDSGGLDPKRRGKLSGQRKS